MAFRFRKTKSILPGVKINLGKRGISASMGPKGAKHTIGTSGRRTTVGLPGSGISFTKSHRAQAKGSEVGIGSTIIGVAVIVVIIWGAITLIF